MYYTAVAFTQIWLRADIPSLLWESAFVRHWRAPTRSVIAIIVFRLTTIWTRRAVRLLLIRRLLWTIGHVVSRGLPWIALRLIVGIPLWRCSVIFVNVPKTAMFLAWPLFIKSRIPFIIRSLSEILGRPRSRSGGGSIGGVYGGHGTTITRTAHVCLQWTKRLLMPSRLGSIPPIFWQGH